MIKKLNILVLIYALILCFILSACSVSKPTVKQFVVTEIHDGFFAAKNGKTVLLFGTQDSVYVGKVINVSIGKK